MSMPDVNELKELIGRRGFMKVGESLLMAVKIVDARIRFGRVDYRVVPLADGGEGWAWITSIRFIQDDKPDNHGDSE